MTDPDQRPDWITDLCRQQSGVLSVRSAIDWAGWPAVRWRLESG